MAACQFNGKTPRKIRNSPTNPFKPGRPSDENKAIPINPASTGAGFRKPPNWSMPLSPPLRSCIIAINQNSAPAVTPWLNICRITPFSAAAWLICAAAPVDGIASAKIPSRQ